MDTVFDRASNSEEDEENEDFGTPISDTELSDLSDTPQPSRNKSPSPQLEWISSNDKPDPSQRVPVNPKRRHIDCWSDEEECSVPKTQKGRRKGYTYADKKAILEYISETNSFNKVKGRQFWETMADANVCPDHTWQSLKEHYVKQIIPNIKIFRLPKSIEKLFLRPFPEYREKKCVRFKEDIENKNQSEGFPINIARHVGEEHHSSSDVNSASADCPNNELSLQSQRTQHPESSPENSNVASEWLSSDDKNLHSQATRETLSLSPGRNLDHVGESITEKILKILKTTNSEETPLNDPQTEKPTNMSIPYIATQDSLFSLASRERLSSIPAANLTHVGVSNTEEILKMFGCTNSTEMSPLSIPETEDLLDIHSSSSEIQDSLFSEASRERLLPTAAVNMVYVGGSNTEEVLKMSGCTNSAERSPTTIPETEDLIEVPTLDSETQDMQSSEGAAEKGVDSNNTAPEEIRVTVSDLGSENTAVDDSSETESESLPYSSNGENKEEFILPIRKCNRSVRQQPTPETEKTANSGAEHQKADSWLSFPVPQKTVSKCQTSGNNTDPKTPLPEVVPLRAKRREYTYEDKKAILNYVAESYAYDRVKGRQFWQSMVKQQVCPGRTWQSLREHYIKQIIPNICIFRLPKDIEDKYLAPFV